MVLIMRPRNRINVRIRSQGKIRFRVEVDFIEERGAYLRNCFKGGTDLITPY